MEPSAVPIKVFGHMVYSWVCKHLYVYARSRRTSGSPWRPGFGLRPPLPYDAVRFLLARAEGQSTTLIARNLRCTDQTVRNAIHAFHQRGLPAPAAAIVARPHTMATIFDVGGLRSPPDAPPSASPDVRQAHESVDARAGCRGQFRRGPHPAAGQRRNDAAGPATGSDWKRAKHWSTSPDPAYVRKKTARPADPAGRWPSPTWALGFGDEVWWSRLAQPNQHGWTDAEATHKLQELTPPTDDPDPKALACYGLLVRPRPQQADQMWLRFVDRAPGECGHHRVSGVVLRPTRGPRLHGLAVDLG